MFERAGRKKVRGARCAVDNETMCIQRNLRALCAGGLLAWLLVACSPALNWRNVPLEGAALTVALPCKPDRAVRAVDLGGVKADLAMVGCEADGALFAVSNFALPDPAQAGSMLLHWRTAVLARLGTGVQVSAQQPFVPVGALSLPGAVRIIALGQRPEGGAVTLQAVWFARVQGTQVRLYHAALYTDRPRPELADRFFEGLKLEP